MTPNPDRPSTRNGLCRGLRAGTGALALSLLAAGCTGGGDASPTGSGAATVGASTAPTVSSSASVDVPPVLTLHKDFFPVPQADAKDIPWDQVGPGWFLVDAHQHVELDLSGPDEVRAPEAVGGLSLVSPDGEWYAARSFAGTEAADSVHWAADGGWLLKNVDVSSEGRGGDIVRVDLATGTTADVATNEWGYYSYASAAGGVTVGGGSADVQDGYHLHNTSGAADPSCIQPAGIRYGDLRTVLAPDGQRVACWTERRTDERTDVGFLDLRNPSTATYVDIFRLGFWRYESLGWLSNDTFLLARLDDDHKQEAYFSYDLSTQKITDFALPFKPPGDQGVEAFDYASQVFFTSDWGSDSIGMYRANGDPIATVTAGCPDESVIASWALSGEMALVSCGLSAGGDATLVNLETGNVVGTWAYDPGLEVRAYGYPQHAG
jgi:hypothetical protein